MKKWIGGGKGTMRTRSSQVVVDATGTLLPTEWVVVIDGTSNTGMVIVYDEAMALKVRQLYGLPADGPGYVIPSDRA